MRTKMAPGGRARAFEGWAPEVGVLCLYLLDLHTPRPFLPVVVGDALVEGWLFHSPSADLASPELRTYLGASQRSLPCYRQAVPRTYLRAIPRRG